MSVVQWRPVGLADTAAACGVGGGGRFRSTPSAVSSAHTLLCEGAPFLRPTTLFSESSVPLTRTGERHGASGPPYTWEESAPLPPFSPLNPIL